LQILIPLAGRQVVSGNEAQGVPDLGVHIIDINGIQGLGLQYDGIASKSLHKASA